MKALKRVQARAKVVIMRDEECLSASTNITYERQPMASFSITNYEVMITVDRGLHHSR